MSQASSTKATEASKACSASLKPSVVIVGAGPAGVRAAQTLVAHGLRPVVIDESPKSGGQIYRRQPSNFSRPLKALYGFEAGRAGAVHATFDTMVPQLDYRANSLVWNAQGQALDVLDGSTGATSTVPYSHLIIATGATDRVLPFEGWTLPGVFTLGGTQVALKYQGCAIGQRPVLVGTGPLLYLVAYQYAKAGVAVQAVIDSATLQDQVAAVPALAAQPGMLIKGAYYLAWLLAHGVPIYRGARPVRALGDHRVTGLVWHDGKRERKLSCDAIGTGYGLRSETQLADLLGCEFEFSAQQHAHLPVRDDMGRSSVAGVYLAGDGASIQGAIAAELSGELAAWTLLGDLGKSVDAPRIQSLHAAIGKTDRFGCGLERGFALPKLWADQASDALVICRCENITAGELRQCVATEGVTEINRLKALTRVGMGRCQGRMCGGAAIEVLAHAAQQPVQGLGRLRAQAPIKPVPLAMTLATVQDSAAGEGAP